MMMMMMMSSSSSDCLFTNTTCVLRYCLLVALSYLSLCQITRVYVFDYGMYSADFTG